MYKLTFRIIVFYLLLFSSPKLLDILLGSTATILELLLITLLWFYGCICVRSKLTKKERKNPDFFLIILILGLLLLFPTSLILRKIPITVIIYRIFPYFSFYPLIYLFIYLKRKSKLIKRILVFTILLCNITSLGIVYDFSGGLINTPFIGNRIVALEKESGTVQHKLRGGQRRGSFFIGGSTGVYPFLSLGILSSLILFHLEREKDKYIWQSIVNLFLVWLGCLFSLSRAPLFLATTLSLYCLSKFFLFSKLKKLQRRIIFIGLIFGFILVIPIIQEQLQQQLNRDTISILQSGLSPQEKANYKRYYAWYEGSLLFTDLDSWIGYGLGTSNLAVQHHKLLPRNQYRSHYESSIFSTFSEGGIIGLCILFFPFIIIIISSKSNPHKDIFLVWSAMLLLNLFAAPIYSYSSQIAYFMGMSLCVSLKPERQKLILMPSSMNMRDREARITREIIYKK